MGRIAVTGATGYVGGRLVPLLIEKGFEVLCIVREPRKLAERTWRDDAAVEVVRNDLTDSAELESQLSGCKYAYYLVHSMIATGKAYADQDQQLANNFAIAAKNAGVERIIYLGGLGELGTGLSEHLRSRRAVEDALSSTGIQVTTLRAAMIIGSGSASFEILRYLVERLPIMITPRWVETECQPVAINDVLYWLVQSIETPETAGRNLEIGGPDIFSYRKLMKIMAEELGVSRRLIFGVPVLSPRLSSGWISLITPVSYRIARPLADGLRNRVVVRDETCQELMPLKTMTVQESIHKAISTTQSDEIPTRWSAAGPIPGDPDWAGGKVFIDKRSIEISAGADDIFAAVCRVGGGHGWYAGDILWRIRGWMDQLVGGPGLRRGRRNTEAVEFGEALDFWRVVGVERPKSLLLHAEMRLPGTARLEFRIESEPSSEPKHGEATRARLSMTAYFRPRGLFGILYWYSVLPLHSIVFGGMLRGIKRAAESSSRPNDKVHENGYSSE